MVAQGNLRSTIRVSLGLYQRRCYSLCVYVHHARDQSRRAVCFRPGKRIAQIIVYRILPALEDLFPRRDSGDSFVEVVQRIPEIEGAGPITDNKRVCEDRGETALQVENNC